MDTTYAFDSALFALISWHEGYAGAHDEILNAVSVLMATFSSEAGATEGLANAVGAYYQNVVVDADPYETFASFNQVVAEMENLVR